MTQHNYRDPSTPWIQRDTGLTQRQIVNLCKREGWPWHKIHGRIWVCADFEDRLRALREKEATAADLAARSAAAAALGSISTPKKAAASRANGAAPVKPGSNPRGRPRKQPATTGEE